MLTLLWLAACQSNQPNRPNEDGGNAALEVIPAPFTAPGDVAFADALTAHHEQAVLLAEQVIARGEDPDFVAMASTMRDEEQATIERLQQLRTDLTDAPLTPVAPDPFMDAQLADLTALSGMDLEKAFLEAMIPHHAGAIQLAHRALPQLDDEELIQIAEETRAQPAREIGLMREMLDRVEPEPPPDGEEPQDEPPQDQPPQDQPPQDQP